MTNLFQANVERTEKRLQARKDLLRTVNAMIRNNLNKKEVLAELEEIKLIFDCQRFDYVAEKFIVQHFFFNPVAWNNKKDTQAHLIWLADHLEKSVIPKVQETLARRKAELPQAAIDANNAKEDETEYTVYAIKPIAGGNMLEQRRIRFSSHYELKDALLHLVANNRAYWNCYFIAQNGAPITFDTTLVLKGGTYDETGNTFNSDQYALTYNEFCDTVYQYTKGAKHSIFVKQYDNRCRVLNSYRDEYNKHYTDILPVPRLEGMEAEFITGIIK